MADSPNIPNQPIQPGQPAKKELSMETRLLLAFLLMGLVLFLTPYIYKPPPQAPKPVAPVTAQQKQATQAEKKAEPARAPVAQVVPGQIQDTAEKEFTVETDI